MKKLLVVLLVVCFMAPLPVLAASLSGVTSIMDGNRMVILGISRSTYIDARVLAVATAESHTVPTGAKYVLFSANGTFYANFGGTAAIPSDDVTDGTGSVLNPTMRIIDGATAISLIAPAATIVTMEFFR